MASSAKLICAPCCLAASPFVSHANTSEEHLPMHACALTGLSGTMKIIPKDVRHYYEIEYELAKR